MFRSRLHTYLQATEQADAADTPAVKYIFHQGALLIRGHVSLFGRLALIPEAEKIELIIKLVYCLYYLKSEMPIKCLGALIAKRTKQGGLAIMRWQ